MNTSTFPGACASLLLASAAFGGAGGVVPIQPMVPNWDGSGFLEVVGSGSDGDVFVVVQLEDVASDNTPFMGNISVEFYNSSEIRVGLPLVISPGDISDALGNNDGNIDDNDVLTIDITSALQNRPAGSYAMDVFYADPGGDGDSMVVNFDGFPAMGFDSDAFDTLFRIIDEEPTLVSATREDTDMNGLDDTMVVEMEFPALGFGPNANIRSSLRFADRDGIANPNSIPGINTFDWEKNTGGGYEQFEAEDILSTDPIEVGDTSLVFRFDEMTSDLRVSGLNHTIRVDPVTGDVRGGSGNIVDGEALLEMTVCEDGGVILADCNENGMCDRDEIAMGMVLDCNENGVPDICELMAGAQDHNGNGILDECEPDPSADLNGDGFVDSADLAILLAQWGSVLQR